MILLHIVCDIHIGTRCIEAGMRAVALQRLMGHSDISVTLNTYVSVFNKYKEAELEKLNNYYLNNNMFQPTAFQLLEKNNYYIDKEEHEIEER